jgi:uncharacterized cupin superfamily protein
MSDIQIKRIEELDYYKGANVVPGIKFRSAARQLGVTAWGMGVLDIEPNFAGYPEHDHTGDGQEEVYVVLRGSAKLRAGGGEHTLEAGTLVRVGPSEKRHFTAGPQGLTLLAIGATPGKAYAPRK